MKRDLYYIQVAVLVAAALVYAGIKAVPAEKKDAPAAEYQIVERVIDGDTIKLESGLKVRLIGVDTPESYYSEKLIRDSKRSRKDIDTIKSLGKKASNFTKSICAGKRVRLEYDVEKKDRYARTLAYVYLEDGTFVNAKILEEGYGQVMTVPPNVKNAQYFLDLERQARQNRAGLWKITDAM